MQQPLFETENDQPPPRPGVPLNAMVSKPLLLHGDCLEHLKTIESGSVDLIITDPPYGTKTNQRDTFMVGEFSNIMPLVLPELHRVLKPDGGFYCFTSWSNMSDWLLRYQQYFKLQNIIVWDKERHGGCYSSMSWQFTWEGIFYGIKGKRNIVKYMPDVVRSHEKRGKAMVKPVDVIEKLIEASATQGAVVLDPFMGRGSTGMACKNLGMEFIGIEIESDIFDEATKRIEAC